MDEIDSYLNMSRESAPGRKAAGVIGDCEIGYVGTCWRIILYVLYTFFLSIFVRG